MSNVERIRELEKQVAELKKDAKRHEIILGILWNYGGAARACSEGDEVKQKLFEVAMNDCLSKLPESDPLKSGQTLQ